MITPSLSNIGSEIALELTEDQHNNYTTSLDSIDNKQQESSIYS